MRLGQLLTGTNAAVSKKSRLPLILGSQSQKSPRFSALVEEQPMLVEMSLWSPITGKPVKVVALLRYPAPEGKYAFSRDVAREHLASLCLVVSA